LTMKKLGLKQDKNLLSNSLFFASDDTLQKDEQGRFIWDSGDGFKLISPLAYPRKTDYVLLLGLLFISQEKGWTSRVKTTRRALLKLCGMPSNQYGYKKLGEAIDTWFDVSVNADGCWYNGTEYETFRFKLITGHNKEKKSKNLEINFNPIFIEQIKTSSYFHTIDLQAVIKLGSSFNIRLYSILAGNFYKRKKWSIGGAKLANKIPIVYTWASHLTRRVQNAIDKIKKYTGITYELEIKKKAKNEVVYTFYKLDMPKEIQPQRQLKPSVRKTFDPSAEMDTLFEIPPLQEGNFPDLQEAEAYVLERCEREKRSAQQIDWFLEKIRSGLGGTALTGGYSIDYLEALFRQTPVF